jgi:coenzyme F420-reducing hydrogenase gamma subunit
MTAASSKKGAYLGVPLRKPRVAFFELSSCEGCQLQVLNREETLLDFLSLVEIVRFREAMSGGTDDYEIAFVEGSVTRRDEAARLRRIRKRAKVLVALGSCACFGGVNRLKNRLGAPSVAARKVYGFHPVDTDVVRPVDHVVPVDLRIFGCPIRKEELEKIVLHIALGKTIEIPRYPVCMECRGKENLCLYDHGEICLGPVTRAGCGAWCPDNRFGCWGCRGPAEDANVESLLAILRDKGFPEEAVLDRLECFGGFEEHAGRLRTRKKPRPSRRKR